MTVWWRIILLKILDCYFLIMKSALRMAESTSPTPKSGSHDECQSHQAAKKMQVLGC